jgi:hypothetical protein
VRYKFNIGLQRTISEEWPNGAGRIGYEAFMAVKVHVVIFWIVAPCSFIGDYRRFG